ncbi:PEP/pyruvate-binding domain-containing protein, partial [Parabacteroides distasonis]
MRRPVEIEFAVTLNQQKKNGTFYLLQIRPMVDVKANLEEDLNLIKDKDVLLKSNNSLGHGIMEDIQDVIYVKTDGYTASNNPTIAYEIEK